MTQTEINIREVAELALLGLKLKDIVTIVSNELEETKKELKESKEEVASIKGQLEKTKKMYEQLIVEKQMFIASKQNVRSYYFRLKDFLEDVFKNDVTLNNFENLVLIESENERNQQLTTDNTKTENQIEQLIEQSNKQRFLHGINENLESLVEQEVETQITHQNDQIIVPKFDFTVKRPVLPTNKDIISQFDEIDVEKKEENPMHILDLSSFDDYVDDATKLNFAEISYDNELLGIIQSKTALEPLIKRSKTCDSNVFTKSFISSDEPNCNVSGYICQIGNKKEMRSQSKNSNKDYFCKLCEKRYKRKSLLKTHYNELHRCS